MENPYDEDFRAMNFCKGMLNQVPEMKAMFDELSRTMDELMELNKDIMEDIGKRLVKVCLKNLPVVSEHPGLLFDDPNLVFQHAVNRAAKHICDFLEEQQKESRKKVLQMIDRYWEDAKNEIEETAEAEAETEGTEEA